MTDNLLGAYIFLAGCLSIWAFFFSFGATAVSDFLQDYGASVALRNGDSIYGDAVTSWARTRCEKCVVENFHPPFVAVLMLAFGSFAYVDAAKLQMLFSLAAYLTLLILLLNEHRMVRPRKIYIIGLALLWYPFLSNTYLVNWSVFIALPICLAGQRLTKNDDWLSGVLLAFAAMIKFFPLAFLLYLFFIRRWIAFVSMLISLLALSVLTLVVVGMDDIAFYFSHAMQRNVQEWAAFPTNQSFLGFFSMIFYGSEYTKALFSVETRVGSIYLPVSFAIVLFSAFKSRSLFTKGYPEASYCLFVIATVLASPIFWIYGFVILLMPIVYLFSVTLKEGLNPTALIVVVVLLSISDGYLARFFYGQYAPDSIPLFLAFVIKAPFFGLLGIYFLFWKIHKERSLIEKFSPN